MNNVLRLLLITIATIIIAALLSGCKSKHIPQTITPEKLTVIIMLENKGIPFSPSGLSNIEEIYNETGIETSELSKDIELVVETQNGGIYKIRNNTSAVEVLLSQWFQEGRPIKIYIYPTKKAGD